MNANLPATRSRQLGFSLIELMIAISLGMLIVAAVLALFLNINGANNELAKVNSQIENGRFAIQLLENDVVHAGFWGTYVPQFDDLTFTGLPTDAPTAVPDPCAASTTWSAANESNLVGIPVQSYDTVPCGFTNQKANTDVLVVRHADTCVATNPATGNCEIDTNGKLYFQSSLCELEIAPQFARGGSANTITLAATASPTTDFYKGATVTIVFGTGFGQTRTITAYDGTTKIATVAVAPPNSVWAPVPDATSQYSFGGLGYVLNTAGFGLHEGVSQPLATPPIIGCVGTGTPPALPITAGTIADKRKFVSNIYYIRDYAVTAGDGIPTLVRSTYDVSGAQGVQPLIEGIDGFRVELGIDIVSKSGVDITTPYALVPATVACNLAADPRYKCSIDWADPATKKIPSNRGDGIPEGAFVHCTTGTPCTVAQLTNVTVVKMYVLARAKDPTFGYTDAKTYTLGSTTLGPFNDNFKRHVFSTTVRLTNVSGRRETP